MSVDHFAHKAGTYDQNRDRVENVANIAGAIVKAIDLNRAMHIMDFGSGTGLLLERIAPYVAKITAVDVSPSMNAQLEAKRSQLPCELELVQMDLEQLDLARHFDGIISSMTMHHIRDIAALFEKFHALLTPGGFIAIADLDREDGSFHTENMGVHHAGFDRKQVTDAAAAAGFHDVAIVTASVLHKPQGSYPVFLLTARR